MVIEVKRGQTRLLGIGTCLAMRGDGRQEESYRDRDKSARLCPGFGCAGKEKRETYMKRLYV